MICLNCGRKLRSAVSSEQGGRVRSCLLQENVRYQLAKQQKGQSFGGD